MWEYMWEYEFADGITWQVLCSWLSQDGVDFAEVSMWYSSWKQLVRVSHVLSLHFPQHVFALYIRVKYISPCVT
jgi:hypothetical protein